MDEFLAIIGQGVQTVADRMADVFAMLDRAAAADCEIAALAALASQFDQQRATTATWIVQGLAERSPLRAGVCRDHAVDTMWLLMDPAVFRRLTRDRGWGRDAFRRWFTDSVSRLLSPPIPTGPGEASE